MSSPGKMQFMRKKLIQKAVDTEHVWAFNSDSEQIKFELFTSTLEFVHFAIPRFTFS